MTIADPKKYAQKAKDVEGESDDLTMAEKLEAMQAQLEALIAQKSGTPDDDRLEKILLRVAQMSADAHERAANPSNKTHPGISVFSYPEGDRARPRTELKCEMFWVGYPIELDTTTVEEIDLLNMAEPGIYQFQRYNHKASSPSLDKLTVTGETDPNGTLTKLLFTFNTIHHENRDTPMTDILRTAFGVKSPEEVEIDALRAEVARLKAREAVGA